MKKMPQIKMTVALSKRTIEFLKQDENMTSKEIAVLLGTTPAYLNQVTGGKKSLQPKHLKSLQEDKPDIYLHILQIIVGEKLGNSVDFLKGKTQKITEGGRKGIKAIKGVTGDVAFAVCKLLTHDD